MQNKKLKAVDFFCGAGGVTKGFSDAGITVIGGIDIDINCRATYEKNNTGSKFVHADLSIYRPEELEAELDIRPDDDNLIFIGCSPCQFYSIINTSKDKAERGKMLLDDFRRFVDYFRPGFIFIENVPGIENKDSSPLQAFKAFISNEGYICDDKVVNAAFYNVPQNRRRYILLATRHSSPLSIPKPSATPKSARAVLEHYPTISAGHRDSDSDGMHWSASLQEINILRLSHTPHDGGTRLAWKDNPLLQLKCYKNKDHMFRDVYARMHWDTPSPTITTRFLSISNGRFGHPVQNRGISIREGASLQSFPDSYVFLSNNIATVARMIGNAVPPKLAERVAKRIIASWLIHNKRALISLSSGNLFVNGSSLDKNNVNRAHYAV